MFYLFGIVSGLGYGGIVAVLSPLVAELFGLRAHGTILGMIAFNTAFGAIGPLIAGRIFDVSGSYQLGFLAAAILCVLGLILVLFLKPRRNLIT